MEEFPDHSKEVCKEMLEARGYKITGENIDLQFQGVKGDDTIWVIMTPTQLNIQLIKKYVDILNRNKIRYAILIYSSFTNQAKKVVENLDNIRIELFSRDEMQFNITKHELVPQHIKLSPEEVAKLRKELKCPNRELKIPTMLTTDAVARFYGYKEGDCIKIIRKEGFVMYRIVKKP